MGLLRLLLALAVVAAHAGPPCGLSWLRMTDGPTSVQCFYVISGFYMAMILNEKYVGPGSYAAFARSRLLRLAPMFLVTLLASVLTAVVLWAVNGIELEPLQRWRHHGSQLPWGEWLLLALSNLTVIGQDLLIFFAVDPASHDLYFTANMHTEPLPAWQFQFVPQAWTVAIELTFYSLAPLLVRRRLPVILAIAAASLLLRVWLMRHFHVGHDPWTYRFFPTELALFLAGSVAWHVYRFARARGWLRPWLGRIATGLVLALVVLHQLTPTRWQSAPYGVPPLAFVVALLLPWLFAASQNSRLDRSLGELSYPVYLVHYLVVMVTTAIASPWLTEHRGIVVMAVTLLLATLLWHHVGRRFESVRQRLVVNLPAADPTGAHGGRPA